MARHGHDPCPDLRASRLDRRRYRANRYLWILVPIVPAIMVEQVGIACLRGAGDTVSGFVVKAIVVAIDALKAEDGGSTI